MPAPDAVDGSSTGMAMRQNAVSVDDPPMSVHGTIQSVVVRPMNGCC